jgi:excisionase family DNA binding protein
LQGCEPENDRRRNKLSVHCAVNGVDESTDNQPLGLNLGSRVHCRNVDVAEYLRVHSSTVRRQLKGGQFPAFKVGSDWRFKIESIDRWCLDKESAFPEVGGEKKLKLVRKGASAPLGS